MLAVDSATTLRVRFPHLQSGPVQACPISGDLGKHDHSRSMKGLR